MQGKRTIQCARSVISPDPDMHVNEVGIPQEMADKLTFPERVFKYNLAWCQKLVDDGQVNHIKRGDGNIDMRYALFTRGFKLMHGDVVIREGRHITPESIHTFKIEFGDDVLRTERTELDDGSIESKRKLIKGVEPPKRKSFKLKIGDEVERKLQNGDVGIVNRQPTLHEGSMKAKKVRIHNMKTIQFGLADTASWGADFDGDLRAL